MNWKDIFRTRYEQKYSVTTLAGVPFHPAMHPYLLLLAAPPVLAAAALSERHPAAALGVVLLGLLCAVPLMEGDRGMASSSALYAIAARIGPVVDRARAPLAGRARVYLLRIYARVTRPLWTVLLGVPALAAAQDAGLVSSLPDVLGGVGLTEAGLVALWDLARALAVPWLVLFALRLSTSANLDLPEMRPDDRISGIAIRLPPRFFAVWRVAYFVGLPVVALALTTV
jgi:hypothetical protein